MTRIASISLFILAGLAACRSERTTSDYRAPARQEPRITTTTSSNASREHSPEVRILSILHAKNEEEVRVGKLAQDRGASDDVKQYGQMLVNDHTEMDTEVMRTAQTARIKLLDPHDVSWMLAREKGATPRPDNTLENLSGAEFDRVFAEKMRAGHDELITMVNDARSKVTDPEIGRFLDKTLPKLQHHQQMAQRLVAANPE